MIQWAKSKVVVTGAGGFIGSHLVERLLDLGADVIAFVQAATQLQEQTLQYAAKFFAIVITIFITASLLGGGLYQFGDRVFSEFAGMVRR